MKNFLKYSVLIFSAICLGVLMIFGVGKIYSSFNPWPQEKKEAYQFYLLQREIISNPELLSKITVLVQKDNNSSYDTISPLKIEKLYSYPQSYEILIKIPHKEWDKHYGEGEETDFLFSRMINKLGTSSKYFFVCRNNKDIGVKANIVNRFERYYDGKLSGWTQTSYNMNHEKGNNEDPIIILREARRMLRKI